MCARERNRYHAVSVGVLFVTSVALLAGGARGAEAQQSPPSDPVRDFYEEYKKGGLGSDVEKLVMGTEQQVAEVMAQIEPLKSDGELVVTIFHLFRYPPRDVEPWRERAVLSYLAVSAPEEPEAVEYLIRRIDFRWPMELALATRAYFSPQWPVANYPAAVLLETRVGARVAGPAIFAHLARTPPEDVTDKQVELFAYIVRNFYGVLGHETLEAVVQTAEMKESDGAKENRRRLLEAVRKTQKDLKRFPPPQIP